MSENPDSKLHADIVHRLRSQGLDRWTAINEADRRLAKGERLRAPVFQPCHCGLMAGNCTCKSE